MEETFSAAFAMAEECKRWRHNHTWFKNWWRAQFMEFDFEHKFLRSRVWEWKTLRSEKVCVGCCGVLSVSTEVFQESYNRIHSQPSDRPSLCLKDFLEVNVRGLWKLYFGFVLRRWWVSFPGEHMGTCTASWEVLSSITCMLLCLFW